MNVLVAQSCLTLCDPMDGRPPGSICPWNSPGKNIGVGSLVAQRVKHLPAMWETCLLLSLGWEDPLQKEMATHSSILAWKILWTQDPGRL